MLDVNHHRKTVATNIFKVRFAHFLNNLISCHTDFHGFQNMFFFSGIFVFEFLFCARTTSY